MKSAIICHGDCDGIISAFLYIKHYLMDSYPKNVQLIFTQPWRAQIDARKLMKDLNQVVVLDLALSREFTNFLKNLLGRISRLVIIDHHVSSREYVSELDAGRKTKVILAKAPSTPRLMIESLKPIVNPYEEFLIDVADVCEGNESRGEEVTKVADLIKLSIARDPGDIDYLTHVVNVMLKGQNVSNDLEIVRRAKIAKFLLHRLLKVMADRSLEVAGAKIASLDLPESRIFAGLLGVAATEFAKMSKSDVVLVRREEGKVVVTVRSLNDRAFRICRELASRVGGRYGGHAEAASATLPDLALREAVSIIAEVLRNVPK